MNSRLRRRLATLILGTMAPLLLVAEVAAVGHRAEAAAPSRPALATNPVQCLMENAQCARDAASGNYPCDLLPC
jgi:hypothetical protein